MVQAVFQHVSWKLISLNLGLEPLLMLERGLSRLYCVRFVLGGCVLWFLRLSIII
jgi:hypothetical protein